MSEKIYGLILAAGFSSRMDGFKPLVLFGQKPFIAHIIDKLSAVCDEIIVVTGFNGYALEDSVKAIYNETPILLKIDFIHNKDFVKGMFSSVQVGSKAVFPKMQDNDHVMLHLVDQPHISENVYTKLADKAHGADINVIVPSHNRRAGHPIVLSRFVVEKIIDAPVSNNLRNILNKFRDKTAYIDIPDESIIQNINTPEEREKYLK